MIHLIGTRWKMHAERHDFITLYVEFQGYDRALINLHQYAKISGSWEQCYQSHIFTLSAQVTDMEFNVVGSINQTDGSAIAYIQRNGGVQKSLLNLTKLNQY